jgi:2-oxoglutarate ferredoxin oxidoreductase subunit delta
MRGEPLGRYWRTPLDAATDFPLRGRIHIQETRCKGCGYCTEFCPLEVLALSSRFNLKGYHPPEVVHDDRCVACGLCELLCPEFAIGVEEIAPAATAGGGA